jgi:hypothetical protein
MPSDLRKQEYLNNLRRIIKEHGWAVQNVMGNGASQNFVYSVGLTLKQRPEIIMIGLFEPHLAQSLINRAATMSETTQFVDMVPYIGIIDNYPVMFQRVTPESARKFAILAFNLYNDKVRLIQMFLPDRNGNFPWNSDCEARFREQAALNYYQ